MEGERVGHKEDLCICTMLDPRFKNFDFKRADANTRAEARKWLIDVYVKDWAPAVEEEEQDDEVENTVPAPKRQKRHNFLYSDSDSDGEDAEPEQATSDQDGGDTRSQQPASKEDPRREEVMKYLALPQVQADEDFDLLEWWRAHESFFPNLAKMARQFLALPASSAGVERLFSAAGEMHDKKRKRTSEMTLSHMLNIKVNAD